MKHQYQFDSLSDMNKRVNKHMIRYAFKVLGYVILWAVFFFGSLAAIGWIVANSREYNW